ncbi:MAG: hypothetical protein SGCHY_003434 [Lobulomycetales sp.]
MHFSHIFFNRRAPFDIDTQFNKFWENYDNLQALSPGKEILVGEFGWPSAGIPKDDNPNNLPCPGKAERVLARFVCETAARSPPVGYVYFSAFDAYWKPDSHEKHWGVLKNDRSGPKEYVPRALNCANYDPNAPEPVCELTPGPFDLGLLEIVDGVLIDKTTGRPVNPTTPGTDSSSIAVTAAFSSILALLTLI